MTPAVFYFHLHCKLLPAFTRILLKLPENFHIVFDWKNFIQEKKLKTGSRSIQIYYELINCVIVCVCVCVYVCVCVCVKFELIFQYIVIVQSFDVISSHRQNVKNTCRYHMKFPSGDQFGQFKRTFTFKFNKTTSPKVTKIQFRAMKVVFLMFLGQRLYQVRYSQLI